MGMTCQLENDTVNPLTARFVYVIHTPQEQQHSIAQKIPHFFPCKAMVPFQIKRKWTSGQFTEATYPLMPGYIFLFSNEQMNPAVVHRLSGIQKVLQYGDKVYALAGDDERLARWLARYDGVIGLSQAILMDGRIQGVQGPMKDEICKVTKVDNRRRRAKIELQFQEMLFSMWLDFDWAEGK